MLESMTTAAADAAVPFTDRGNFDRCAQVARQQADTTFLREGAVAALITLASRLDRRLSEQSRLPVAVRP